jgi:hypothetical protein
MNKYEKAHIAWEQGYKMATRYKTGDVFHGGVTLAERCYEPNSLEAKMFLGGYLDGLDERFGSSVPCDVVRGDDGTELYLIK